MIPIIMTTVKNNDNYDNDNNNNIHNHLVPVLIGNLYRRDLCLVSCEWLSFDSVNIESKYFWKFISFLSIILFNAIVFMMCSIWIKSF